MRGRGSYRPFVSDSNRNNNNIINNNKNVRNGVKRAETDCESEVELIDLIEDNEDIKQIEDKNVMVPKKRKSFDDCINVIAIESDEELEEDVQTVDSDYESIDISYMTSCEVEEVSGPAPKKCRRCLQVLSPSAGGEYAYNSLTAADFYANPRIHSSAISQELRDRTRFDCFQQSMAENKDRLKDKTVLIIGSGNGLLALFAAKAMAKTVIVFERPGIQEIIELVIKRNKRNLSPNGTQFHVIREMLLPNGISKVDAIVSDWVNHSLFHKSMIELVIKARDKWLRKDGLMIPDSASMWLVGAHDYIHEHKSKSKKFSNSLYVRRIDYWDSNVYGFDMTAVSAGVMAEPLHETIESKQVITNEFLLKHFNFYKMSIKDIEISTPFELTALKDHYLQTFVLLFDVIFTNRSVPIMYSTKPRAKRCVFRPTVFVMDSDKHLTVFEENKIKGHFKYCLTKDFNHLFVEIGFEFKNQYLDRKETLVYNTD